MTAIHLVRVTITLTGLARWAAERGWGGGRRGLVFDEGRVLHHLVDEVFGPGALRPFRLLVPPRHTHGNLYAYSTLDATALRETEQIQAKPEHLNVLPLHQLESKPMPEDWRCGQRLGFDVRVRPTRRLRNPLPTPGGRLRQGTEMDAFWYEALRNHPEACDGMKHAGRTRTAVYLDWLAQRLSSAATLDRGASRLARFQRHLAVRGDKSVEGPDAVIHGTLTITDGPAFASLLAHGVGRHRAYGYGMLLLNAPQRPVPER